MFFRREKNSFTARRNTKKKKKKEINQTHVSARRVLERRLDVALGRERRELAPPLDDVRGLFPFFTGSRRDRSVDGSARRKASGTRKSRGRGRRRRVGRGRCCSTDGDDDGDDDDQSTEDRTCFPHRRHDFRRSFSLHITEKEALSSLCGRLKSTRGVKTRDKEVMPERWIEKKARRKNNEKREERKKAKKVRRKRTETKKHFFLFPSSFSFFPSASFSSSSTIRTLFADVLSR